MTTWTNQPPTSNSWIQDNPSSASWENDTRQLTIEVGTPIGLLLSLTYAESFTTGDSWTLQSPNAGGFILDNPTTTIWS